MNHTMLLKLMVPTEILVKAPVKKIIAEGADGFFCLLPAHMDFVSALVPGILYFVDEQGGENYYAVNHGTLIKYGREVRVSSFNAVRGADLAGLKQTVEEQFNALDEQERSAHSALARLEAGTIRRFMELQERMHG